jgi:hypothetical protein
MQTSNFESGSTVRLLIPEAVWREWKINGVDADSLAEVQAEHGAAVGYEFEWGQIIEEVIDGYPATAPCDSEDLSSSSLALCWNFVLSGVHGEFLDGGGNLVELSDLAVAILADIEDSRDELPETARDDGLPTCISVDEGDNISAFAIFVFGRSNIACAREWVGSFFIPGVLPLLIDRLREENKAASGANVAEAAPH